MKRLNLTVRAVGIAVLFGLSFWLLDSIIHRFYFGHNLRFMIFEKPDTLFDAILLEASPHMFFVRISFLVTCIIGGLLTSIYMNKYRKTAALSRESEERYRLLAENVSDLISKHTPEGVYTYASPTCLGLLGYEPRELVGHDVYKFVHAEDVERVRDSLTTVLTQSTTRTITYRLRRKDGRYVWVETASKTVRGPDDGDAEQVVSVTRDVTRRQRAEEEIKKLARFPEENPNPVMRVNTDGVLFYANRASRPLLSDWDCQVGQSLPEPWPTMVQEVLKSQSKKDTEIQCETQVFSLTLAPAGDTAYVNMYGLDITQRKQAKERIQRLLDQQITINRLALALGENLDLDTIYGTIHQHACSLMDTWGFIVSSYEEETGLIRAEYAVHKGCPIDVTEFPPIPVAEPGRGAQSRVILSGEPFYAPDYRASMETGKTEYTVSENGTITEGPPPDEEEACSTKSALYVPMKVEGKTFGVMQLQSPQLDAYKQEDIELLSGLANMAAVAVQNAQLFETLQRSNEQLAQHREHLEDLVAERTCELDRRMVDVEQLNRALSNLLEDQQATNRVLEATTVQLAEVNQELENFAYVVSHDLKAPLRAITQLAGWISTDYAPVLDEDGQEYLQLLVGRTKRMHNLIEGILQYSRVGRVMEREKEIDLDRLVQEVIEALAPPAHIQIIVQSALPTVVGEQTRLGQVFQNLLDNAIKYMDKPKGRIIVDCSDNQSHWLFSVTDNGPGIEERYHDKVFQMFQTLAPRDEIESTGVGLALAKKIIETNGGKIWVESTVGQGSTFHFTLPKKGEHDHEDLPTNPSGRGRPGRRDDRPTSVEGNQDH